MRGLSSSSASALKRACLSNASLTPPIASTSRLIPSQPLHSSSSSSLRSFSTTLRTRHYRFFLGIAAQGKPSEVDLEKSADGKFLDPETGKPLPEELQAAAQEVSNKRKDAKARGIGWPSDTPIGQWRDSLLGEVHSGEDAVMAAETQSPSSQQQSHDDPLAGRPDVAIGVADGVGSWSENGIDPALFSQALMYHSSILFSSQPTASTSQATPKKILADAFKKVQLEKGIPAGSSTATILTLESSTGTLRSANLGDSGFIILRDATSQSEQEAQEGVGAAGQRPLEGALYRSVPQQYSFNAPFQLSKLPPAMLQEWKQQAIDQGQDPETVSLDAEPAKAAEYTCQLRHGDIVIVATDGAWDNVWGKEWVTLVRYIKEQHHEALQSHIDELKKTDPELAKDPWLEEKTLVKVVAHK